MESYANNVYGEILNVINTKGDRRHLCWLAHLLADEMELSADEREILVKAADTIYK
jgi:hypothetical protein